MSRRSRFATAGHVRDLVSHVLDDRGTDGGRAGHARTLADYGDDLQRSLDVACGIVSGSQALDMIRAAARGVDAGLRDEAMAREEIRQQLRSVETPFGTPVILSPPATGLEDAAPLIRKYARRYGPNDAHNRTPIVPGLPAVAAAVVFDPDAELEFDPEDGHQVTIADVSDGETWHYAAVYSNLSKQLVDFAGSGVSSLIDRVLRDVMDVAAEENVVAAIEAAGTDVPGSLLIEDAEGPAGAAARGPVSFLLCSPEDWPAVRKQVAASWQLGPHPVPIVSSGASAVTLVGANALEVLIAEVETFTRNEPSVLGKALSMWRPFKLVIRDADAIQVLSDWA